MSAAQETKGERANAHRVSARSAANPQIAEFLDSTDYRNDSRSSSFRRTPESRASKPGVWTPAFAGVTKWDDYTIAGQTLPP